jgi:hypothetical protein
MWRLGHHFKAFSGHFGSACHHGCFSGCPWRRFIRAFFSARFNQSYQVQVTALPGNEFRLKTISSVQNPFQTKGWNFYQMVPFWPMVEACQTWYYSWRPPQLPVLWWRWGPLNSSRGDAEDRISRKARLELRSSILDIIIRWSKFQVWSWAHEDLTCRWVQIELQPGNCSLSEDLIRKVLYFWYSLSQAWEEGAFLEFVHARALAASSSFLIWSSNFWITGSFQLAHPLQYEL